MKITGKTFLLLFGFIVFSLSSLAAQEDYRVPHSLPVHEYQLKLDIDTEANLYRGTGDVSFVNTGKKEISIVAFKWLISERFSFRLLQNGQEAEFLGDRSKSSLRGPLYYLLPDPVEPGEEIRLQMNFGMKDLFGKDRSELLLGGWYPRLYWDNHSYASNYQVKFNIPEGYTEAASGLFNPKLNCWEIKGAKNFGIYLGKYMRVKEADVEGVKLRVVHPAKGEQVAAVAFETAQRVIRFYKEFTGFYPYKFINIVPGGPGVWGGYPFNPGTVVIHGMEKFEKASLTHWKWITAHEIGHQYWGEYVLDGDDPGWLWIGLGIYLDREYWLGSGETNARHLSLMSRYLEGLRKKYDTTIDISLSAYDKIDFDHNNIVVHGKGFAVISALDWVVGKEKFKAIVLRCLKEFAGKRLGYKEFWSICEEETGEDLTWFFHQWVRSNAILLYKAGPINNEETEQGFLATVTIQQVGDLAMPVPVRFEFADGSFKDFRTNRFQEKQELSAISKSKLVKVVIDREKRLAMIDEIPPRNSDELVRDIKKVSRKSDALRNLELYHDALRLDLKDGSSLFSLGMLLYGGSYYKESVEVFERHLKISDSKDDLFLDNAWLGLLYDMLGKREKALAHYSISLQNDEGDQMSHSQYGLRINKGWLEERLKKPHKR